MNSYDIGDLVRVKGTFRDSTGAVADPTFVTLKLKPANDATRTYTYGTDIELIKDSTGIYYVDVSPNVAGHWTYQWKGTGAVKTMEESHFAVRTPEIT